MQAATSMKRAACSMAICLPLACAAPDGKPLAVAVTDTLPGGIVAVSSAGPTAWADTLGWQLVANGALEGDVGSPGEFIDPQSFAVDERGWVYVADTKPAVIKVFDDSGRYVRSFGREGSGPGEFRAAFLAVRDGMLVVHDPRESRTSLFDTAGTFIRGWVSECCYWASPALDERGRIAIPAMTPQGASASQAFLRFDTLGNAIDTLLVPEVPVAPQWTVRQGDAMVMSTSVPYSTGGNLAHNPAGGVIFGWSGEYRLAVSDNGRNTSRVFGRAWSAEPIDDAVRDAEFERRVSETATNMEMDEASVRVQFAKDVIPHTYPAFSGLSVDGRGNVWVYLDEGDVPTRFDVFDASGAYLGRVHAPVTVSPYASAWSDDVMYVRNDTDDGYPRISRYRIVRPE
jgi:hypothetical protein